MPAVTLRKRTIHSSQNWRVRTAFFAETLPVVCIGLALIVDGSKPSGFQSGCGTRMT
ncbi:Uncharacterised protein [Mycobacteroides abscessus subsp. abscessus]|nr:Uncharacterised protein [Mycobacteroides abscessus subsp. abscessus]